MTRTSIWPVEDRAHRWTFNGDYYRASAAESLGAMSSELYTAICVIPVAPTGLSSAGQLIPGLRRYVAMPRSSRAEL